MTYFRKTGKPVLILIVLLKFANITKAQEVFTGSWQIGLGLGYTNYYGDLSNYRIKGLNNISKVFEYNKYYVNKPSLSLLAQKKLTPTLGFMLQANILQFAMSDRYRKRDGSFDINAPNYSRSLNFRTDLRDIGLAFTFSPNNGKIGREDIFFYPSFFIGVGVSNFDVKGDLYNEKGNRYDYLSAGNIMDGEYETKLRDLRTETESRYRNVEPYVDLGLALNFRINQVLTIALQSDIKYSASDYLDDVSAKYKVFYPTPAEQYAAKPGFNAVDPVTLKRGDDNGRNDFYINNRVVLNISLPKKQVQKKFSPPVIYSLSSRYFREGRDNAARKKLQPREDSILLIKTDSLKKVIKDPWYTDSIAFKKAYVQNADSNLQKQLTTINNELQVIKSLLGNQQNLSGQQLQFRYDSIKTLSQPSNTNVNQEIIDSLEQRLTSLEDKTYHDSVAFVYDLQGNLVVSDTIAYLREITKLQQRDRRLKTDSIELLQRRLQLYRDSAAYYQRLLLAPGLANETENIKQEKKWYQKIFNVRNKKKRPIAVIDTTTASVYLQQQRYYENQASDARSRISQVQKDSAIVLSAVKDNENIYDVQVAQLKTMLQRNADSISQMQRQIQRSGDSAAYYKRMLSAEVNSNNADAQESRKWYNDLFTRKKETKKRADAVNATRDTYVEQQSYYDDDVSRLRRRLNEAEQHNRQLTDEYNSIGTFRSQRAPNSYIQPASPVIVYDRDNGNNRTVDNAEIVSLRNELERLRSQVNENGQQQTGVDRSVAATQQDSTAAIAIPGTAIDSSQISSLRRELAIMRSQLDSLLKSKPAEVIKQPVAKVAVFDPSSFPLTSVYFKTGAVTLTGDELSKLTPFAQVALKNVNVHIVLKGFTDPVGNPETNKGIAARRTSYISNYLITRFGITSGRILLDEPSVSEGGKNKKPNPLDRRVDCKFE